MADAVDPTASYEVRQQIGKGAFGSAFLVVHKDTHKLYVLKRIRLAKQTNWQRNTSHQEARLASLLRHPYIVPHIQSWVQQGHTVNIVYGYCERGDLATLLAKQKGQLIPEEQLRLWLCQMLLALDYLQKMPTHQQANKVLHRDVKTSNVMLTSQGDAQLGDFGLATFRDTASGEGCQEDTNLVGTPHFMSPELLGHRHYSFKTDVWSLGCVFYEMSAQKPAFNAFNIRGLAEKIQRYKLPPLPAQYSAEWAHVINCMLRKDPGRRPSVQELMGLPCIRPAMLRARARALELSPIVSLPPLLEAYVPDSLALPARSSATGTRQSSCDGSSELDQTSRRTSQSLGVNGRGKVAGGASLPGALQRTPSPARQEGRVDADALTPRPAETAVATQSVVAGVEGGKLALPAAEAGATGALSGSRVGCESAKPAVRRSRASASSSGSSNSWQGGPAMPTLCTASALRAGGTTARRYAAGLRVTPCPETAVRKPPLPAATERRALGRGGMPFATARRASALVCSVERDRNAGTSAGRRLVGCNQAPPEGSESLAAAAARAAGPGHAGGRLQCAHSDGAYGNGTADCDAVTETLSAAHGLVSGPEVHHISKATPLLTLGTDPPTPQSVLSPLLPRALESALRAPTSPSGITMVLGPEASGALASSRAPAGQLNTRCSAYATGHAEACPVLPKALPHTIPQQRVLELERVVSICAGLYVHGRWRELGSVLSTPGVAAPELLPALQAAALRGPSDEAIHLGDTVLLGTSRTPATVRYYGPVHWDASQLYVGLETQSAASEGGMGQRDGVHYFDCAPGCARFVAAATLAPTVTGEET